MARHRDPVSAVETSLARVEKREPEIHAWAFLDPERARAEARNAADGPLHGLTVGVKDIFDTGDQPTEYGSPIYRDYQPRGDAAAVALLRAAGGTVLGKTITAELAWTTPGPTTNPHRTTHTPGGSSSGSAATVADGMVDVAIGSQTAGSVIRPASFCGVFGLKPTFGLVPTAGVKQAAPSLDTVGMFATDVGLLELVRAVLTGCPEYVAKETVKFGFLRTDLWADANPDCREVIERAAGLVGAREVGLPEDLVGLADELLTVQAYEGAKALTWERVNHPQLLSAGLRNLLDWGASIEPREYDRICERVHRARSKRSLDALFDGVDVLVSPAAVGEAPEGLSSTGDPRFCRLWTFLGCPALSVPGLVGSSGMPIGVQLSARPNNDALLVHAGRELQRALC